MELDDVIILIPVSIIIVIAMVLNHFIFGIENIFLLILYYTLAGCQAGWLSKYY